MNKQPPFWQTLILTLLLLLPLSASATSPVAMISDLQGNVSLHGTNDKLQVLSEVNSGDLINIEPGATLVLVYYVNAIEYSLTGPAVIKVADVEPQTVSGNQPVKRNTDYDKGLKPVKATTYGLAQAALAMRGADNKRLNPEPLNLMGTRIVETHPVFRWKPFRDQGVYHLALTDATGLTILETDVQGNSYQLPENIKLHDDEDYFWYLSVRMNGKKFQGHGDFTTATPELRRQVAERRPGKDASFSERVMFATWLESQQLDDAAREVWTALAKERPHVTALQEKLKR